MICKNEFEKFNIGPDAKVAVVSHNDLDGVGPVIVAKNYFKDVKYFNVSNMAIDKVVKLVLFSPEYEDREVIFITDASVTDAKLIASIEDFNNSGARKIFLFDHHGTALHLNKYDWAEVTQEEGVSGTKLFWRYLQEQVCEVLPLEKFLKLDNLVEKISSYDTWTWVSNNDPQCYELSNLFSNTGVEYFLSKYVGNAWNNYFEFNLFSEQDKALMADLDNKMKFIIMPAIEKSARVMDFVFKYQDQDGNVVSKLKTVKCVTVTTSVGDLAEKLYEDGIDYVAFFYHDTISVRSRVDDVDLGSWAKYMGNGKGGGGHKRAAGFPIHQDNFWMYNLYLTSKFGIGEVN